MSMSTPSGKTDDRLVDIVHAVKVLREISQITPDRVVELGKMVEAKTMTFPQATIGLVEGKRFIERVLEIPRDRDNPAFVRSNTLRTVRTALDNAMTTIQAAAIIRADGLGLDEAHDILEATRRVLKAINAAHVLLGRIENGPTTL